MVIDTSALVAILNDEAPASRLLEAIEADPIRFISAASVVEAGIVVLGRFGDAGETQLDRLLRALEAEIIAVDEHQATIARDAALRFGRGRHPAALNFGDCFSYALSAAREQPLLFVGDDFARTDIQPVPW